MAVLFSLLLHAAIFLALWHRPIGTAKVSVPTLEVRSVMLSVSEADSRKQEVRDSQPETSCQKPRTSVPFPERPSVEVKAAVSPPACESEFVPEPEIVVEPLQTPSTATPTRKHKPETSNQQPSSVQQARIEARLEDGVTIRPDYPRSARRRGEQGTVTLLLTIDETGKVTSAEVVSSSGYKDLDVAAIKAALQARFKPAEAEGRPVASTAILPISFRLK